MAPFLCDVDVVHSVIFCTITGYTLGAECCDGPGQLVDTRVIFLKRGRCLLHTIPVCALVRL